MSIAEVQDLCCSKFVLLRIHVAHDMCCARSMLLKFMLLRMYGAHGLRYIGSLLLVFNVFVLRVCGAQGMCRSGFVLLMIGAAQDLCRSKSVLLGTRVARLYAAQEPRHTRSQYVVPKICVTQGLFCLGSVGRKIYVLLKMYDAQDLYRSKFVFVNLTIYVAEDLLCSRSVSLRISVAQA